MKQPVETATRLEDSQPDTAQKTYAKQAIKKKCTQLTTKANLRKEKLLDS